jgi:hypothetical protein
MPPDILASLIGAALCLSALLFGTLLLRTLRAGRRSPRADPAARAAAPAKAQRPGEAIDTLAPPPPAALPYTRQPELLTRAERDFFAVLRAAAPPGWLVFPHVRLANLVTPRSARPQSTARAAAQSWRCDAGCAWRPPCESIRAALALGLAEERR